MNAQGARRLPALTHIKSHAGRLNDIFFFFQTTTNELYLLSYLQAFLSVSFYFYCVTDTRSLNCLDREAFGLPNTAFQLSYCRGMSQNRVRLILRAY